MCVRVGERVALTVCCVHLVGCVCVRPFTTQTADQVFRLLRKRCPTLTWTRLFSAVLYVYDSVLSSRQALLHAFQAYDSDNHKVGLEEEGRGDAITLHTHPSLSS